MSLCRSSRTNARLCQVYERPGHKEKTVTFEDDDRLQHCSSIATRSLVQKKEDPGAFTIPCTVGSLNFAKALLILGKHKSHAPLDLQEVGFG